MSDHEQVSKRARQKQRRGLKKEAERRMAARARRRRMAAFMGAGLVVVALAGAAVANEVRQRAEVAERERSVAARLDELGCSAVEELEVGPTAHFSGQELAANPPEVAYPDRPAAAGRMAGGAAEPGVYSEQVDERLIVHSLEHGFVTMYHAATAPRAQVEALKAFARERMGGFSNIIVAPWDGSLPSDANFAVVSWAKRQLCREFDADVFLTYLERNYGPRSNAPEAAVGSMGGENPVRPDGDGPFLLPPLTGAPPSEATGAGQPPSPAARPSPTEDG